MFGIDVSHHQGSIEWGVIKENNPKVDFAIIKATEGQTYVDPSFKMNSFYADKAGIPISYYHFATLNSENVAADAEAEAKFLMLTIRNAPVNSLPLVLDIETNKGSLSPQLVLAWIHTFFNMLECNGYPDAALYSYTPFLDTNLPENHDLGGRKLWIAAYTPAPQPKLPRGWKDYWLWQHSAKGRVSGIKSDVDSNISKGRLF